MKQQINEIKRMQQLAGIIREGFQNSFYAPEYLEQKYGKENAKKIEAEIDEMDANSWDRFTGMESAKEVEDYIADIKDILNINESQLNEDNTMYYIHDEEGMEEPIGPFTIDQAKQELVKHGMGWKLIDAETAKQIWSHLEDEEM